MARRRRFADKEVMVGGQDLRELTLAEAASLVRRKKVSPVELAEGYLRRIEALNPKLNAYITVAADEAMRSARQAEDDVARGLDLGPLHGVPLAIKDLFATRGLRTTAGSKILADWVPEEDAHVVTRLRQAGAFLLGKLNMHEWAAGATTINPHFGPTTNPWDTTRIPGGSSGGSAAAIAAALCAGSLGSDTAGSIRMPSSLCGIVGLKPTYGLASLRGVLPLSWSLDHVGPMTRTVEDAALVMESIAGYDPGDPSSADRPGADYHDALRGDVTGLRLGLPRNYFFDEADREVVAAVRRAASLLEAEGAHVAEVDVPGVEQAFAVGMPVLVAEAAAYHEKYLQERPGDYGEDVLALLKAGQSQSAVDYVKAQRARIQFRQGLEALFTHIDALLTPTTPITAPTIEQCRAEPPTFALIRCTAPFNLAGLPALSVPCGLSKAGLPIGLQIAGRHFEEAMVLRVGAAYEQASAWRGHVPLTV
jgi:aspartyl-tRNA(Asn)/glutamyl-tRNA(Gln) amidotransferase subunit A